MTFPNRPYIGDQTPNEPFSYPEVPATFDRLFGSLVPNIQLDPEPGTAPAARKWQRPSEWLDMPSISETEQKFVGLFPVFNTIGNFVALYFEGDYTVDWGDGTTEDFNSGDKAQHSYDWADISPSTVTSIGYRQVLVTVTPQSGQDLTVMDMTVRHENLASANGAGSPWLEVAISMPQADSGASLRFSGSSGQEYSDLSALERVNIIHAGGMDDFYECFYNMYALKSVSIVNSPNAQTFEYLFEYCHSLIEAELLDTSSVESCYGVFYECYSLPAAPLFDTSNVTDMGYMFEYCHSLQSVPLYDTSAVTNMGSMFEECYSLSTVPLFNTANVTDMGYMFNYCYALTTVPLFNTANVTNMNHMFGSCYALTTVPLFNTASVTAMNSMFFYCYSLTSVPLFNTANVTSMYYMFNYCYSLTSVPLFNTANVTSMDFMFNYCYSLTSVPLFNTANVTTMVGMFGYARSLSTLPAFDVSSVTQFSPSWDPNFTPFYECKNLQSAPLSGTLYKVSFANCLLSRQAIVDIFNGLGTVTPGPTKVITVSGNYGAAELTAGDLAIASGKGWQVAT